MDRTGCCGSPRDWSAGGTSRPTSRRSSAATSCGCCATRWADGEGTCSRRGAPFPTGSVRIRPSTLCVEGASLPAWRFDAALPPAPGPDPLVGPAPGPGAPAVSGAAREARSAAIRQPGAGPVRGGRAHAAPERGAAPAHASTTRGAPRPPRGTPRPPRAVPPPAPPPPSATAAAPPPAATPPAPPPATAGSEVPDVPDVPRAGAAVPGPWRPGGGPLHGGHAGSLHRTHV